MFLRKIIFILFILATVSYAVFAARGVLFAPHFEVFSPKNGEKIIGTRVIVSGSTSPKIKIWIDGRITESNEQGLFEESMFFHPGYNEMGISVKNRFGKETRKVLKFVVE